MKYFISLKTLYNFFGTLMFICALLLALDGFGIRDLSAPLMVGYYGMIVVGFIGRGLIRMREGRKA